MKLLKTKVFKRRGTGDLTEAIEDVLDRRDTKNLKKYADKLKNSENFLTILVFSGVIFAIFTIGIVAGTISLLTPKYSKVKHTANIALNDRNINLHFKSSVIGNWGATKSNLMLKTNDSYSIKFTPKKTTPFYFKIGDATKNSMYEFGANKSGENLPLNKTVPAYNGIGIRAFVFKPDELSEHQLIFQIQSADKFALKIIKTKSAK